MTSGDEPIQAAGGVVWRRQGDGVELLLIHRPRYDDWTLPKGKADSGDADAAATAVREVWEETGLRCDLGAELGQISYEVKGRPKVVRYWAMQVEEEQGQSSFVPNAEVDRVAWLAPEEAKALLVYLPDAQVVDRFLVFID